MASKRKRMGAAMMMASAPPAASANAVILDANNTTASIPASLSNQNDELLKITNDPSFVDVWQMLNLEQNIYRYQDTEVYPTTSNNSTGASSLNTTTFQFNTPGWSPASSMYLEIPIELHAVWDIPEPVGAGQPFKVYDPSICFNVADFDAYLSRNNINLDRNINFTKAFNWNNIASGWYPDFCMMEIINKASLLISANTSADNTAQFYKAQLKQIMRDYAVEPRKIKELSQWGFPIAHLDDSYLDRAKLADTGLSNVPSSDVANLLDPLWIEGFTNLLSHLSVFKGGVRQKVGFAENYRKTVYLPINLGSWFTFMKGIHWFPPDFSFKLDLETFSNEQPIMYTTSNINPLAPIIYARAVNVNNMRIKFRTATLPQALQLAINTKWSKMPLNYLSETATYFDIPSNNQNRLFQYITYSQQTPQVLKISLVCTGTDLRRKIVKDSLASFMIEGGSNTVNQTYLRLQEILVDDGGVTMIRYNNQNNPDEYRTYMTVDDMMYWNQAGYSYGYNQLGKDPEHMCIFNTANNGAEAYLVINPNQYADRGEASMDQGAKMISVTITLSAALPDGVVCRVTKVNPIAVSVNVNKQATTIAWPAFRTADGAVVTAPPVV